MKTVAGMDWGDRRPEELADALVSLGCGRVAVCARMADRTAVRIGGPADVFVEVDTTDHLVRLLRFLGDHRIRATVMGMGQRLLVHDGGVGGVVIGTSRLGGVRWEGSSRDRIEVEAGVPLSVLAAFLEEADVSPPGFLAGASGTVGWALAGRSGMGLEPWRPHLAELRVITPTGRRMVLGPEKWRGDRTMPILRGKVLSSVVIWAVSRENSGRSRPERVEARPDGPALGTLFHPVGRVGKSVSPPVAELIHRSGLAGVRVNGARIAPEAPNWIENLGNAAARDVITLIKLIRERVKHDHGVVLQPAVEVVGRPVVRPALPWLAERRASV